MKRERRKAAPSRPLWVLLTGIWLVLAHTLMAQSVYKVTDTDGNVTFTDTPPLSSDSIVEEHSVHAPNSAKPTATTQTSTASVEVEVEVPTRYDTRIVTPAENATIPMGPGNFAVQAALSPRLASSETLQLLLDGEPVGAPQRTVNWQLTNVYRGEHRLRVVRLDESGAPVDTSAATTVFVMRPIVNR
jgi:hypothetical protein